LAATSGDYANAVPDDFSPDDPKKPPGMAAAGKNARPTSSFLRNEMGGFIFAG